MKLPLNGAKSAEPSLLAASINCMAFSSLVLAATLWSMTMGAPTTPTANAALEISSTLDDDQDLRERMIVRAFSAAQYQKALRLVDEYLAIWPETPHMHYNRACAFALLGRRDAAGEALLEAVKNGFQDFETMRRDPDLASMRNHETFTAILEAKERVVADANDGRMNAFKDRYDQGYVQEKDNERKLMVATGLGGRAHAEMMEMIGRQSDEQAKTLFPKARLDWCFVLVPTEKDAPEVFKKELNVDDPRRTPGVYLHGRRLLVSRDIGASMRHEFTHRMHWADMETRGQRHPMWIQEGLASLYEDYEWRPDGSVRFVPNIRHNIARKQVEAQIDLPFEKLFLLDPDSFLAGNARYYPQARSIFEFLADLGLLAEWYSRYCETFNRDPSGAKAFEKVFGLPIDDVNGRWKRWVRDRGRIDDRIEPGDASIGIKGVDAGDGIRIESVVGLQARRAGLRRGDVIMRIDGRSVRAQSELVVEIASREVGEIVRLEVRRGSSVRMVEVRLEPLGSRARD